MPIAQSVKERAYLIDPECWRPYSGRGRDFKRAMETRRFASLERAAKTEAFLARRGEYRNPNPRYMPPLPPCYGFEHSDTFHADIVFSQTNGRNDVWQTQTWIVPGTYDAEADQPSPPTMFGHPFDMTNWRIKLDDQFYSAGDLREIAGVMDDVHAERNR